MTASYLLAFYPKEENRKIKDFRTVKIEVAGKDLILKQNRNGYLIGDNQ